MATVFGKAELQLEADMTTMVEKLLKEALKQRYEPGLLNRGIRNRLEAALDGSYAAHDACALIVNDVIRCLAQHGCLVEFMSKVEELEAKLLAHYMQNKPI